MGASTGELRAGAVPGMVAGGIGLGLLLGALGFQYLGGLPPCEMCHWQRWPHAAAAVAGLGGGLLYLRGGLPGAAMRPLAVLAIFGIALSGAIGIYHAGVEWMWWQGPTTCTGLGFVPGVPDDPNAFRLVRCDVAAWRLFGLSLAGYNALISLAGAGLCLALLGRKR